MEVMGFLQLEKMEICGTQTGKKEVLISWECVFN